jgi:hypothetical protein
MSRFQAAITGALAITAFSLIGGGCTVNGNTGPAAASVIAPSSPAAAAVPVPVPATATTQATNLPRPDHIVIVVEENESPITVTAKSAPYIGTLARHGANFTDAYAETHPSEPNYLALFSGSTHGLTSDSCPHTYAGANLGSELIAAGRTFVGYAESMPSVGFTGCTHGSTFARKHTPWVNFSNVPSSASKPFSAFPSDFTKLPTVAFVTPNLCDDMHDCPIATGDAWLKANLGAYATWAKTHNSLLIVTFDEAETGVANRIPLIVYGQPAVTGRYTERVNHYSVLRTIEDMYSLPCTDKACDATSMADAFKKN